MTNHVKEGLAPCKRCEQAAGCIYVNDGWFAVECENCPYRTSKAHRSEAEAVAEWNRRAPSSKSDEQVSGLADVLERIAGDRYLRMQADLEENRGIASRGDIEKYAAKDIDALNAAATELRASRIPDKGEVVAWAPRIDALVVVAKRLAEHLTGKRPSEVIAQQAAEFLYGCIVEGALSPLYASPQPSSGSEVVVKPHVGRCNYPECGGGCLNCEGAS